jgi:4-nitrophenyl phosphatase
VSLWDGVRGLLVDLDGVVYTGDEAIDGAAEFVDLARTQGVPFLLVTNNSTASPEKVAARLGGMGIAVTSDEVMTSAQAAAGFVQQAASDGAGDEVLVIGEEGLRRAVVEVGLRIADDQPNWVIAGLDRHFDYDKLTRATRAILSGARFVATNADALLPIEGGQVIPGAGSIVAALSTASGVQPIVVGKPERGLFEHGLRRLGNLRPYEVAMIGDRLDTDVVGGQRAGLRTVLVLSGVTSADQVAQSDHRPDAIAARLRDVADLLGWR